MITELDFSGPAFAEAVLDAAPVIVLVLDARGRILHYNAFTERLTGRPAIDVRGLDWFDEFLFDDERDSIRTFFARSMVSGPVDSNVNFIRGRGGERRMIEWYDRKLYRDDGGIRSVVAIGVDISDRVREASERSELAERFELFANRVDDAFFMTDVARTRVLYLSPAFERIAGISRELVYADVSNLAALLHPDDRSSFLRSIGSAIPAENKDQVEREYRILRPILGREQQHELRWVSIRYSEVSLHGGEARRVVGTMTDITARRQAAQQFEELGRIFALFNGSVDEVFLLFSPTRDRILYASESVERMFGVERQAVYADIRLLVEHVHPDDRERMAAIVGERVASPLVYEFRVLMPDGSTRWFMMRLSTLGTESSMVGAVVAIAMDITARHESEQALRRLTAELEDRVRERTSRLRESLGQLESKKARLADAQRIAEVGDWEWNVPTSALHWSDQIFRIFGLEVGSVEQTYQGFLATVHEEDRPAVMAAVDRALLTGEHYEIEHRIVRPDGEVRFILENGEVTCEQGKPVRMNGTARDVTRQKQVEAQLRASLAEKDALLHEVHHRVKNNLQVVASLLYLKGINSSTEIREVIDECSARIRSMALIHEQLYVSGQLAAIEMREFLAQLGEELTRLFAGDRDIRIRVSGEGMRLGIERAVPIALLANELLTNALKYAYPKLAPGHAAEVRVHVRPEGLEIADDGVGLPAGLDGSTASSLGLRLVHSLARQLDGNLLFSGPGTCVRLVLSG